MSRSFRFRLAPVVVILAACGGNVVVDPVSLTSSSSSNAGGGSTSSFDATTSSGFGGGVIMPGVTSGGGAGGAPMLTPCGMGTVTGAGAGSAGDCTFTYCTPNGQMYQANCDDNACDCLVGGVKISTCTVQNICDTARQSCCFGM